MESTLAVAQRAVEADVNKNFPLAVALYRQAANELDAFVAQGAGGRPQQEIEAINGKSAEYRARANALQGLAAASQMATLSQVAQQATTVHAEGQQAVKNAGGVQTMAGAAVVGAAAGAILVGPIVGVVAAGAAAYAATRQDAVGDAARAAGQGVVTVTKKLDEINQEHKITERAAEAAKAALVKAKQLDEKHHVVEKVKQNTFSAFCKAKEMEEKYNVTDRVAGALATGLTKVTAKLGGTQQQQGAAGASTSASAARAKPLPSVPQ